MTSPASTGGSGALFEAQVGAAYLLSMLLEVDARGLPNCRIESIRLQRGQEGYPLDDVIIQGQDRGGKAATLEIQVKRSITFAPSDEVFQDVVKQVKKAMDNPGFWASHHRWNRPRGMRATPAGSAMKVRTTGSIRPKKTAR